MAKKKMQARKLAGPTCAVCADTMKLKRVIPAAHVFAELKTFQCDGCGNLRTLEDAELLTGDAMKAAVRSAERPAHAASTGPISAN